MTETEKPAPDGLEALIQRVTNAEAEVKRLTEENEVLRGVLRDALYAITEIDNAHKVARKIRATLNSREKVE
jgi:hypothetical protein